MKLSNHNASVVRCLPYRKRYVIHHTKFSPLVLGAADLKPHHLHHGSHSVQPLFKPNDKRAHPSSEDGDETLYCVCRQPYNPSMWMIACDICDGWFHGRCVSITAQEARRIEKYVCPVCRLNTGKQILWKRPKKKGSKHNSKREVKNSIKKEEPNGTATSDNAKKRRRFMEDPESRAKKRRRKPESGRKLSPQNSPSPGLTEENSPSTPSIEDDESVDSPYANSSSVSSNSDIIKCVCGKDHEDGLMVQCETCSCWLHCSCLGFKSEEEIPDSYVCPPCAKKDDKSVADLLCLMPKMNNNFGNGTAEMTDSSESSAYHSYDDVSNIRLKQEQKPMRLPYSAKQMSPRKMLHDLTSRGGLLLSSAEAERLTFGKEYS